MSNPDTMRRVLEMSAESPAFHQYARERLKADAADGPTSGRGADLDMFPNGTPPRTPAVEAWARRMEERRAGRAPIDRPFALDEQTLSRLYTGTHPTGWRGIAVLSARIARRWLHIQRLKLRARLTGR